MSKAKHIADRSLDSLWESGGLFAFFLTTTEEKIMSDFNEYNASCIQEELERAMDALWETCRFAKRNEDPKMDLICEEILLKLDVMHVNLDELLSAVRGVK